MRQLFTTLFAFLYLPLFSQYPADVEAVLKMSGKNRGELEKAIRYFQKDPDTLKLKAAYFLISNMDIHYSANYYWADSQNRPVPFNELAYPTFEASLKAFEEIKKRTPGIHPVPVTYRDIDSIKGDFLIDNVERAFEAWQKPWSKNLPFEDFCEYILPYRVSVEPLQDWRKYYEKYFSWVPDSAADHSCIAGVNVLNSNLKSWFVNTYAIEQRKEPLPLLGPLHLLFRKQGPCEDMAGLGIYSLRSQGLPCSIDFVNYWATSSGRHVWNVTINEELNKLPFDPAQNNPEKFKIQREPSKVFRVTYSKQKETLATIIPEKEIPPGTLQAKNIKDVTSMYWNVKDLEYSLFPNAAKYKTAYVCVFNYLNWRASYWGKVQSGKTVFRQMGCGAVYLPMVYERGKLMVAGNPIALYNNGDQKNLIPNLQKRQNITLSEQDKYLIYRPGKKYTLKYWDNTWKIIGEKTAGEFTRQLAFDNVPSNALLLLVPEYSAGKERPFTIDEQGQREWW